MKKFLLLYISILTPFFISSCVEPETPTVDEGLEPIVSTKYTTATDAAIMQRKWGALNCHDPKLFQDDDGTYYVYSTDASIGNAHAPGVQIRSSTDLINWTCNSTSAIQGNWDPAMLKWVNQTTSNASTWAPTVIKQNGKYYMYHGIITDAITVDGTNRPAAYIGLAIADSPLGPFKPAHVYDPETYSQSSLVRYAWSSQPDGVTDGIGERTMSAYLGGESPSAMTVTSVTLNGTEQLLSPYDVTCGTWNDYTNGKYYITPNISGSFELVYTFTLDEVGTSNWQKWAFMLSENISGKKWYLRADAYTNDAGSNLYGAGTTASVAYTTAWTQWNASETVTTDFHDYFAAGKEVVLTVTYSADTGDTTVSASVDGAAVYTAAADGSPTVIEESPYPATKNTAYYNTKTSSYESAYGWSYGFGAIDPEFVFDIDTGDIVTDAYGDYYMTYGSWKGGIALITVDNETLKPTKDGVILDRPLDETDGAFGTIIAGGSGAGYEGAQLIYSSQEGYYYIFVSMGDLSYEYRVGVGRSSVINSGYVDATGSSMTNVNTSKTSTSNYHNRGNKVFGAFSFDGQYGWRSPGGQSILRTSDGKIMFACHTRTNFKAGWYFYLQLHRMFFNNEGWPVINMNEYYNDELTSISAADAAGEYDVILTERGYEYGTFTDFSGTAVNMNLADANETVSKKMTLTSSGTITGSYTGTWMIGTDGYSITLNLLNSSGSVLGTFTGFVLNSVDWARKGSVVRKTVTFTAMCSDSSAAEAGEHLFANKHNY